MQIMYNFAYTCRRDTCIHTRVHPQSHLNRHNMMWNLLCRIYWVHLTYTWLCKYARVYTERKKNTFVYTLDAQNQGWHNTHMYTRTHMFTRVHTLSVHTLRVHTLRVHTFHVHRCAHLTVRCVSVCTLYVCVYTCDCVTCAHLTHETRDGKCKGTPTHVYTRYIQVHVDMYMHTHSHMYTHTPDT